MTAADYINQYHARRSPFDMVAPWKHRNLLIRAAYWKQQKRMWEATRDGAPHPSAQYDEAFDAAMAADEKYEASIIEAWTLRALERGYTVSSVTTRELSPSMADHANSNERAA
jgi:hypothetical protein